MLLDMEWKATITSRQGHNNSSNMIETSKGKQRMRRVSQEVRADASAGQPAQASHGDG
jgi:hypothetical protein